MSISYKYSLLSNKERKEFAKWAFGCDYSAKTKLHEIDELWNKTHPELFTCLGTDNISETMDKMVDLWRENR